MEIMRNIEDCALAYMQVLANLVNMLDGFYQAIKKTVLVFDEFIGKCDRNMKTPVDFCKKELKKQGVMGYVLSSLCDSVKVVKKKFC